MKLTSSILAIQSLMATVVFASPTQGKNVFLLINGGPTESGNFKHLEETFKEIDQGLFSGQASILYGSGKTSKTTDLKQRDVFGQVKVTPTRIPRVRPEPATENNIASLIRETAQQQPQAATLVFGGHGSPQGIMTWPSNRSPDGTLRSMGPPSPGIIHHGALNQHLDHFAKETLVRTIHLHCFGGAVLGPKNRSLSSNPEDWSDQLRSRYVSNRCSLALSRADEPSFILLEDGPPGANDTWTKIFQAHPKPSIQTLKTVLEKSLNVPTTPTSTTDLFIEDLYQALSLLKPIATQKVFDISSFSCDISQGVQPGVTLDSIMKVTQKALGTESIDTDEIDDLQEELDSLNRKVRRQTQLWMELTYARSQILMKEQDTLFPRVKHLFTDHQKRIENAQFKREELIRKQAQETQPKVHAQLLEQLRDVEKELNELILQSRDNTELLFHRMGLDKDIRSQVSDPKKLRQLLDETGDNDDEHETFPRLRRVLEQPSLAKKILDMGPFDLAKVQAQRKEKAVVLQREKRAMVENWIKNFAPPGLREHYENLQNCENSPLN